MSAVDTSIAACLSSLTDAIGSAATALPSAESILPSENGITLLDAKNELFLSYLQALALRNLEVIRSVKKHISAQNGDAEDTTEKDQKLDDQIVKDLVKHRVYLEKGVRPLEDRLKYQIDKVVRAADDEERAATQKANPAVTTNGHVDKDQADGASEESDEDEEEEEEEINELAYRPNPSAFARPAVAATASAKKNAIPEDGIYRPPRITATAMPTTERREARDRRPTKSATIDEYINTELSTAPVAEPSIGSTIVAGGRRNKGARERADEAERREYEETNLTRLPAQSKKEKAKYAARDRGGYGGEEWRGLGEGLDRIDRLTRKKSGGGALEKSRKRKMTEDGPRGGGAEMGADFNRRKKRVMSRMK
ncbi:hypothetical protein H2203_004111 [Taxawa tesnikishii (nom. ined.)]|nr:hypothetical protein H2203_004111 [Dothideales sp. JES 119]